MNAIPQMSLVPLFSFGSGGIDWPGLGPVLAHGLLAAMIGSVLVLLRESAGRGQHRRYPCEQPTRPRSVYPRRFRITTARVTQRCAASVRSLGAISTVRGLSWARLIPARKS